MFRNAVRNKGTPVVNTLPMLIAVAAGGAVGALARYATIAPVSGRVFYAATLLINVVGSLAFGLLYGAAQQKGAPLWLGGSCAPGMTRNAVRLETD